MNERNSEKPTFTGGLKKGYDQSREMWSTPRGRISLLYLFASIFWLFILTPIMCVELDEALFQYIGIKIGLIVGLAMWVFWFVALVLFRQALQRRRNIRLYGKPKPSLKEALPDLKEQAKGIIEEIKKAPY